MRQTLKLAAILGLVLMTSSAPAQRGVAKGEVWVASWGASQQVPEPQNALPLDDLHDATVRQIVHLSLGGSALRLHLSNAFGTAALHFTSVHIAHPLSPVAVAIDPAVFAAGAEELPEYTSRSPDEPCSSPLCPDD